MSWYCDHCKTLVPPKAVKFDESHEECGHQVFIIDGLPAEPCVVPASLLRKAAEEIEQLCFLNYGRDDSKMAKQLRAIADKAQP